MGAEEGDDKVGGSPSNNMVERAGPGRPAAHHDRWADRDSFEDRSEA